MESVATRVLKRVLKTCLVFNEWDLDQSEFPLVDEVLSYLGVGERGGEEWRLFNKILRLAMDKRMCEYRGIEWELGEESKQVLDTIASLYPQCRG